MLDRCPSCSSIDIGKIGVQQYYCSNCFTQITMVHDKITVSYIESDGSLNPVEEIAIVDERNGL